MLLREKDKQLLVHIFSELTVPAEVWAYGSRVNGTAHQGSDLDLVIRSKNLSPLPINILANLTEKIKESNIPILIELQDWARLPESFHRNIEKQYEALFDNRKQFANTSTILHEPSAEYKTKKDGRKKEKK
ncbi:MAG: nucleotidyltransferase domain-containing protein [Bacteroidia bacterium]